jgi:hypothetical protein
MIDRPELADFARTISGRSHLNEGPGATENPTLVESALINIANVGSSASYGRSFAG